MWRSVRSAVREQKAYQKAQEEKAAEVERRNEDRNLNCPVEFK